MIASNNNYHSILRSSFWCRIHQFLVLVAMYNMEVRNVWVLTSGYTFILILWYIGTILLILGICVVLVTKKGFTSCLPMVGGSLQVLWRLPPIKTCRHDITEILRKVALTHQTSINQNLILEICVAFSYSIPVLKRVGSSCRFRNTYHKW